MNRSGIVVPVTLPAGPVARNALESSGLRPGTIGISLGIVTPRSASWSLGIAPPGIATAGVASPLYSSRYGPIALGVSRLSAAATAVSDGPRHQSLIARPASRMAALF